MPYKQTKDRHTQGKWTLYTNPKGNSKITGDEGLIADVWNEPDAKRICQTHNSFDEMLEACKTSENWLTSTISGVNGLKDLTKEQIKYEIECVIQKLKSAIVQAEGE